MSSSTELKDERVPSFIAYDPESANKKVSKRKREAKAENKPNKRISTKKKTTDKSTKSKSNNASQKPTVHQIWVGAIAEGDNSAFGIYFGENDDRNYSDTCMKEGGAQQDLDYVSVLGTLKAIEMIKSTGFPYVVNTTCRDLPRAITGKDSFAEYEGLVEKIRKLIEGKEQELQVRYISGRKAPEEQKIAINLASEALTKHKQTQETMKVEDNKPEEDIIMTTVTNIDTDTTTELVAIEKSSVLIHENVTIPKEEETIENTPASIITNDLVSGETSTAASSKINEESETNNTRKEEEEEQQSISSWLSSSIKNIFNVLSSPFNKNRNSP
ncbi:MAG: hypothetical protein EXX96DRAFT_546903 [Benjaminiella poitrasii]|nr:MAG: hypothetical protein EXX96DRAFT_546903 [Benjaminiella poitrasii]